MCSRHESAALKADLGTVEKGGTLIVNEDAFTQRNLGSQRVHRGPRLGRIAGPGYPGLSRCPRYLHHGARHRGHRDRQEGGRAREEHVRPRAGVVDVRPPTETTLNWLERKFGGKQEIFDANVAAFKAGYNFGETTELFAHSYLVKAAPAEPGTYRNIAGATALSWGLVAASAAQRAPAVLRQLPHHAGVGAAARAQPAQELRRDHAAGRGRDRGRQHGAGRRVRGPPGRHRHQRPGHGPEGRDAGARRDHGAAAHHRGRPARRSLHRPADQDRAGGPAAGDVRPPRRVPEASVGPLVAVRIASPIAFEGPRGSPCRPRTPGDHPVRHVPVELVGAVEDPRRRVAADDRPELRPGRRRGTFLPYARDDRARAPVGRCRGRPDSSTASGAWSARTSPATSATTR